jgi:hypothetical protein
VSRGRPADAPPQAHLAGADLDLDAAGGQGARGDALADLSGDPLVRPRPERLAAAATQLDVRPALARPDDVAGLRVVVILVASSIDHLSSCPCASGDVFCATRGGTP